MGPAAFFVEEIQQSEMKKQGRTSHKQPRLSASIYTLLFLMVMGFASLAALNLLPVFMERLGGRGIEGS